MMVDLPTFPTFAISQSAEYCYSDIFEKVESLLQLDFYFWNCAAPLISAMSFSFLTLRTHAHVAFTIRPTACIMTIWAGIQPVRT